MNALFIGRFQPFHKGHLQIIQNIALEYDKVIIGIGSSQYKNTLENPFSSEERKKMIEDVLESVKIRNFEIALIPDIHNYPQWVVHVASIIGEFQVVISNSSLTRSLFEQKGYKVVETSLYDRKKFSGKEIRGRMLNDKNWEGLVPDAVVKIIKEIDGVKRLKDMYKKQ